MSGFEVGGWGFRIQGFWMICWGFESLGIRSSGFRGLLEAQLHIAFWDISGTSLMLDPPQGVWNQL